MGSTVSDTDLKLFMGLSNPEKTNHDAEDAHDDEDGEDVLEDESEEEEEEEDGEGADEADEEEEDEDEVEHLPDLSGDAPSTPAPAHGETQMTREEVDYAKTSVLLELERLRGMGCKLTREYTMHDPLEEMEYEARRHVLMMEEQNNVNMMKDGLRLFVSGCEMANSKFGPFLNLDGFSQSVSSELTAGKYNMTLSRLHRKYFKTPVQSAPEVELAMGLLGAAAMHHFQKSYLHKIMPQRPLAPTHIPPAADEDSDEDLPPGFAL